MEGVKKIGVFLGLAGAVAVGYYFLQKTKNKSVEQQASQLNTVNSTLGLLPTSSSATTIISTKPTTTNTPTTSSTPSTPSTPSIAITPTTTIIPIKPTTTNTPTTTIIPSNPTFQINPIDLSL